MGGVKSVKQLEDDRLEWVAEIAGVRRQWTARILEQVPDRKVAWAATEGATNAGAVTFEDVGGGQTSVHLTLEYEPEGLLEKVGDKLNIVENQAEADLDRFKAFIEAEGYATGAWRGSVKEGAAVGTPGLAEASSSVGVPFEATPTYTGQADTEPLDQGDATYGGGAPSTDVYIDRSGNIANPPDNTLGQPTDPDRT
jgi:hypothetical protein